MSCAACAVCALDVARVEAYANSYHGSSWASEVLNFDEFPGGGMGSKGKSLHLCEARFVSSITNAPHLCGDENDFAESGLKVELSMESQIGGRSVGEREEEEREEKEEKKVKLDENPHTY